MTQIKILHVADIHLDSPLQKLESYENAPVEQIRGASRRALENMVSLAIQQQVDLVVIAGDLYDGDWREQNTGLFFVSQATRLVNAGIPIVVIRGNHDAANIMTSRLTLPKNPDGSDIMMAADKVDCRTFESLGVVVHGRSFRKRAETENLAQGYPKPFSGLFNLGLLHTALTGSEGHDHYAPCTPIELTDKQYDYWALGHIHLRAEQRIDDGAPIVFSGNIQGRHIRESGEKGCVIVTVDSRRQCRTTFHPLDVVRFETCVIDANSLSHVDEVIDSYEAWLAGASAAVDDRLLVSRVAIVGATEIHNTLHQNRNRLEGSLRATAMTHGAGQAWLEKLRLRTSTPSDQWDAGDLEGPLASVAKVVNELRNSTERDQLIQAEIAALVKKMPPELSIQGDGNLADASQWYSELIDSAAAELMGRLQGNATSDD